MARQTGAQRRAAQAQTRSNRNLSIGTGPRTRQGRRVGPKDGETKMKEGNLFRFDAKSKTWKLVNKPAPAKTETAKPKPKPQPAAAKPKPKPQPAAAKPKPKPQPAAAKPKPKPKPARSSTYSQAAMMKDIRASDRAAARSKELKKLQELREEAKKKSLEQAKKNRARGNRPRGPRG